MKHGNEITEEYLATITESEREYIETIWKEIVFTGRANGHKANRKTFRNMNPWGHITWIGSSFYKISKFMAQCRYCSGIIQVEFRDYKRWALNNDGKFCEHFGSMR